MGVLAEYIKKEAQSKKISPVEWYEKNIGRIPHCRLATHVGKYTHPEAKAFLYERCSSGSREYVTTASAEVLTDLVYSSAEYVGAAKFLLCELEDSRSLFQHVKEDDPEVFQELRELGLDPQKLVEALKSLRDTPMPDATEYCLRQVYFPMEDGTYRLLTPLPQSSLLAALNKKYWAMNEKRRASRTPGDSQYGESHTQLINCLVMGFGGTKPQNISTLNNGNHGKAALLQSLPPRLEDRELRLPHRDFFSETLPYFRHRDSFMKLHTLFKCDRNNKEIRARIRELVSDLADEALQYCYELRGEGEGWSDRESCSKLPKSQKIWLDDKYTEARKDGQWIQEVADAFGRWFIRKYQWVVTGAKEVPVVLGDAEMTSFAGALEAALREEVRFQS
ncbi:MAG: type I-F CRISPR-associated protein Csy1 [Pyramidobacter sp.]